METIESGSKACLFQLLSLIKHSCARNFNRTAIFEISSFCVQYEKHAELKNGIYRLRKRVFDLGKKHFKAGKLYFNTE